MTGLVWCGGGRGREGGGTVAIGGGEEEVRKEEKELNERRKWKWRLCKRRKRG